MVEQTRISVEHIVDGEAQSKTIVLDKDIIDINSISELGLNHQQQIDLLKKCQESILQAQS